MRKPAPRAVVQSESSADVDPEVRAEAEEAGLRYITDETPGIRRVRTERGFTYRDAKGKVMRDAGALRRIRALVLPPAWEDVWISPLARGHLQATGRDERGRKQYRYHDDWREWRDAAKFYRTISFGETLPRIRRQVTRDLRERGLGRAKVLATVVRLLDTTLIRVGNEAYRRENQSIGLSTMRRRHVVVKRGALHFHFRGKSGREHDVDLSDPRLARIVSRLQDLPGQNLFQYVENAGGERQTVTSQSVNAYLHAVAGDSFSAKDFRTWAGTVEAAVALHEIGPAESATAAKRNVVQAIKQVAAKLGNTVAVCRRCYVHPLVLESYLRGDVMPAARGGAGGYRPGRSSLSAAEKAVLKFLKKQVRRQRARRT